MTHLESLLQRYADGNITPEELLELDRLTRREEVFAGAESRAKVLHRRRVARLSTVASLLIVIAVGVRVLWSQGQASSVDSPQMFAQLDASQTISVPAEVLETPTATPQNTARKAAASTVEQLPEAMDDTVIEVTVEEQPVTTMTVEALREEVAPTVVIREDYTVVACNSACDADSVINDIWRFLHV